MNEPVRILIGGVANVVQVVLALLVAFGFQFSGEQTAAIMAVTTVVTNLILAVIVRSKVSPSAT